MRKNGRKIKKENNDNFLKESFQTITRGEKPPEPYNLLI